MRAMTWYSFWWAPLFASLIVFGMGFIPDFQLPNGKIIGGGIYRDFCVNLLLPFLPLISQHELASFYYSSKNNEFLIYSLAGAHISLFVAWIIYAGFTGFFHVMNIFNLNKMKSERQSLRR